jgi:hypothetical protein
MGKEDAPQATGLVHITAGSTVFSTVDNIEWLGQEVEQRRRDEQTHEPIQIRVITWAQNEDEGGGFHNVVVTALVWANHITAIMPAGK